MVRRRAEPKKIVSKFVQMQELAETKNILIYGDSGVGKTVLAGSAEKVGIISVEKGTISAKMHGSTATVWPIKKWEDLEEAYNYLHDNPDHGFDWIIVDSLTEMQQKALRAILDNAVGENASRDLDIPALQDYQKWQNMFKRFVIAFCDLPVNVMFTALSLQATDEEGEPFLTPDIAGKGYQISQYICGQMSAYGYMKLVRGAKKDAKGQPILKANGKPEVELRRRIIWEDNGVVRAKSRYPALKPYTDDPTLGELAELMDRPLPVPTAKAAAAGAARRTATRRRSTT